MKKSARFDLRLDAETAERFNAAASRLDMSRSRIFRELLIAAAEYIEKYGRWYPPRLVPEVPEEVGPTAIYPWSRRSGRASRVAEPPAGTAVRGATNDRR